MVTQVTVKQSNSLYSNIYTQRKSSKNILTMNASFLHENVSFSQSRLIQYSYVVKVENGLCCTL